jgi:hypothetical protein
MSLYLGQTRSGALGRDRRFESGFLQRRVYCEPDFLGHGQDLCRRGVTTSAGWKLDPTRIYGYAALRR